MAKGYIYIMENPSFKEYVKIGWAEDVEKRKNELNASSAVPFSFTVYATLQVNDSGNVRSDVYVHKLIGMLRPELRSVEKDDSGKIIRKREFFQMDAEDAYCILEQIAGLTGGKLVRYEETKQEIEEKKVAEANHSRYERTIQARVAFWDSFFGYADNDKNYLSVFKAGRKSPKDHWADIGCGIPGAHISLTINTRQHGVAVEFYIPNNKKLYAKLEESRAAIDGELGFEPEWQPLEDCDACRIIIRNELGDFREFSDAERLEAIKWMVEKAVVMGRVFKKYAK